MANTLLEIWRDEPAFVEAKSFRQIIQLAGDGRLRDGNGTSRELREWLSAISLFRLRACVEECLSNSFEDGPLALQDVANEIGSRLGFTTTPGRYRGVKGEVGNDGLWLADDGFSMLVEVKTTDAYRINLDTIALYRDTLISAGKIDSQRSSILIAVGRQETGDLEAQIRGSRHAWDIRLISLEALLRLAEVKEELNDWDTSNKINQLLRPVEYTRLDGIVELLFAAKKDLEIPAIETPPIGVKEPIESRAVAPTDVEKARDAAVLRVGRQLNCTFVRRGRALRVSSDGGKRLAVLLRSVTKGLIARPITGSASRRRSAGFLTMRATDGSRLHALTQDDYSFSVGVTSSNGFPSFSRLRLPRRLTFDIGTFTFLITAVELN